VQSEFYTKLDAKKRKVDGQPLYVLDGHNLRQAVPAYTVFNGQHNGMVKKPLPARPGECVRLYVLNVGPSKTSSVHVVGAILDRVWIEGNPDNQMRGMQTVLLGSSNSAIEELLIPEAGRYIMVDHHFANASQGAIGLLDATGTAAATPDLEHHNIPAVASTPSDPDAVKGQLAFRSKCLACHSVGGGKKLGPDLARVTKRRTEQWLTAWLKAPDGHASVRRGRQADAQGIQQSPNAQSRSERRRSSAIHQVPQVGGRAAGRIAHLNGSRPLTMG
jgi:nitrite reductase (NO-forming)